MQLNRDTLELTGSLTVVIRFCLLDARPARLRDMSGRKDVESHAATDA